MRSEVLAPECNCSETSRLSAFYVIALHLCPGILFSAFLFFLSKMFVEHGFTAYLAELISIPACLMPVLLGVVFAWSRRCGETRSFVATFAYRERGVLGDYVFLPLVLFACWAVSSLLVVPLTEVLESRFFGWFPERLGTQALINGLAASSPGQRHLTFVLAIVFSGTLAPIMEEAYFRGFLLPRMSHLGWKAPVANAFLFGLYHFFSPWSLPAIFVAFLPVVFVVQARKNFRIGLVVHAMFNLMGVFTIFGRTA